MSHRKKLPIGSQTFAKILLTLHLIEVESSQEARSVVGFEFETLAAV